MVNNVIVVFGGSFNPPNNSHFSLAEQIVNEYEQVKKILFVPVGDLYEKEGLLSGEIRYQMLQQICNINSHFDVSDIEIKAEHLLDTIDTLDIIQNQYPDHDIWFTVGTDNLRQLPHWSKAEELISGFKLLVLERDEDVMDQIIKESSFLKKYKSSFIRVKENIRSNSNSTFLRQKLRSGKSIRYLVPDEIFFYIEKYQLFK